MVRQKELSALYIIAIQLSLNAANSRRWWDHVKSVNSVATTENKRRVSVTFLFRFLNATHVIQCRAQLKLNF